MQSDLGKLFVGGISWDTNEERLKEYFSSFGEVLEAVIMKDHTTGRARGFGFIVFSDLVVAERVTREKHNIDGRMVEAKKAVPRDDQTTISRNSGRIQGSPGPARTKKIFVGGLASTVTEPDFKLYFEQYGTVTDVVVMYDHSTQRPRGFGFITYDSEESVEKVLLKKFHELNGKMVEVKRAVPKELSPSPIRSPLGGYPYGLTRTSSLTYSPNAVGLGRFSPFLSGRNGFESGYGMGLNFDMGMSPSYNSSYERGIEPYFVRNSNPNPISFDGRNDMSFFSSNPQKLWGNSRGSSGVIGGGVLGNNGLNWSSSSPIGSAYGSGDNGYGLTNAGYGKNTSNSVGPTLSYDGPFSDFYSGGGGGSGYGADATWRAGNNEQEEFGAFGYGFNGSGGSDVQMKSPSGYVGGYSVAKRQDNRGIVG